MTAARLLRTVMVGLTSLLAVMAAPRPSFPDPPAPINVAIEVTINPLEGPPRVECAVSATAPATGMNWWLTFGHAGRGAATNALPDATPTSCGSGAPTAGNPPSDGGAVVPYLKGRVRTLANFLPVTLNPERVLILNVTASLEKLTGSPAGGEPTYAPLEIKRNFHFLDGREAVIPLLVASDAEKKLLGVREVLLRIMMTPTEDEGSSEFGAILILPRQEGGAILLDGGVAGSLDPGHETLLRYVTPGLHTLGISDSAGRMLAKPIRVMPHRTVAVDMPPPEIGSKTAVYRLAALGRNQAGYEEYRRAPDSAAVVKIPAGEFLMGNANTERTPLEHVVYVSEFLMDKLPVTWGQFKRFSAATGLPLPPHEPYWGIHDDHPAVFVTWEEARTYCEWAGGRLPTEAEREKAARGTDKRKYPWGNEEPDHSRGVFRHEWGGEATEAVGTHPSGASPYGLLDMGGNVWEYCSDWYEDGYYQKSPHRDPVGPATGTLHVVRGGSWDSRPAVLSASCRNWASRGYREGDFGFRCAMNSAGAVNPAPE